MKKFFLSLVLLGVALSAHAQNVDELAKKTQNPIGDIISVPFQFNFNPDIGPFGRPQDLLNIQPVVPFRVHPDWNLIVRTIVPVLSQPVGAAQRDYGLGDIQLQTFLSPSAPSAFIWGVGPVVQMPTRSEPTLGNGLWGAGIGGVVVNISGPWVYGALVNHVWSIGDPTATRFEYSVTTIQPFVNYNFGRGLALGISSTSTANWDAAPGQKWTVPLGAMLTQTFVFNKQPMSLGAGAFYNVVRPDNASDWQFRIQYSLIFPAGK